MSKGIEHKLEIFFEAHPHLRARKYRKHVIEQIVGIDYKTYKLADTINRYFRFLPRDENSHRLETEALDRLGYASKSLTD